VCICVCVHLFFRLRGSRIFVVMAAQTNGLTLSLRRAHITYNTLFQTLSLSVLFHTRGFVSGNMILRGNEGVCQSPIKEMDWETWPEFLQFKIDSRLSSSISFEWETVYLSSLKYTLSLFLTDFWLKGKTLSLYISQGSPLPSLQSIHYTYTYTASLEFKSTELQNVSTFAPRMN